MKPLKRLQQPYAHLKDARACSILNCLRTMVFGCRFSPGARCLSDSQFDSYQSGMQARSPRFATLHPPKACRDSRDCDQLLP